MTTQEMEKMIAYHDKEIAEVWALFKAMREQIKEMNVATDKQIKEMNAATDKKIAQTTENVNKLTSKWGEFVEYVLAPGIPKAFQDWGIPIHMTMQRVKAQLGSENMEIDILAVNAEYAVVVEVKSTLSLADVKQHLRTLDKFKQFFPAYAHCKVLGAVAGIKMAEKTDEFAYNHGLFVLSQSGDTVQITNNPKFKPKEW